MICPICNHVEPEPTNKDLQQQLRRIADILESITDKDKGTLRMVDVERGNVYKTHLGGKLSGESPQPQKEGDATCPLCHGEGQLEGFGGGGRTQCYKCKGFGKVQAPSVAEPQHPCEHVYSRSINQPYPRHCIKCDEIEGTPSSAAERKWMVASDQYGRWRSPKEIQQEHRERCQKVQAPSAAADLLELAWGIIANAGGGDWEKESKKWQDAAIRWRDTYFGSLRQVSKLSSELPNASRPPKAPSAAEPATQEVIELDEATGKVARVFTEPNPHGAAEQHHVPHLIGKPCPACLIEPTSAAERSEQQSEWGDKDKALQEQTTLAAERQRREQAEELQKITEDNEIRWMQRCEKFEQQLLSAQAAIEDVSEIIESVHCRCNFDSGHEPSCPIVKAHDWRQQIRKLDLLHQHDAEVRKPLVDLLTKLLQFVKRADQANFFIGGECCRLRDLIKEIDAVLAQCKEEKTS